MKSFLVVLTNLLSLGAVIFAASLPLMAGASVILVSAFFCGLIQKYLLCRDGVEAGLAALAAPLVMYRTRPFCGLLLILAAGALFAFGMRLPVSKDR